MPPFILNVPNSISIVRLLMIPLASLPLLPLFGEITFGRLLLVCISFILASITDSLDGYYARKLNQKTEWGAYIDPLIDKFLVWALYLIFVFTPSLNVPLWTFVVILLRDLAVTEMRNYALKHSIAFKTSAIAKLKTTSQMVCGGGILVFLVVTFFLNSQSAVPHTNYLNYWDGGLSFLPSYSIIAIAIFTGITGLDYAVTLYKEIKKGA